MSRYWNQKNHFESRVDPGLVSLTNSSKKVSHKPKPQRAIQMSSRSRVLTNSFIELSRTRETLDRIRENESSQQSTDLQQNYRNQSPVNSDCRWGFKDDESQPGQEERRVYKTIRIMIGAACFISIGGLLLSVLMLAGYIGSSVGCGCSRNTEVPQPELQKQVDDMETMGKNMSTLMRVQNQELQRIWTLLTATRKELQQLKATAEIPVSMTTQKTTPTEPNILQNATNATGSVIPSNTPLVDPIELSLTQLWAAHNNSARELEELYFKVQNISLVPGPVGPQGRNGSIGPPGLIGPAGVPGISGTRGPEGPQGPRGPRGYNGTRGPPGDKGLHGPKGQRGIRGPIGLQGPQGPVGFNGSRGPPGPTGVAGAQGNPGNPGQRGVKGNKGSPGTTGSPGPRGAGNFSQCVYKIAGSRPTTSSSSAYSNVLVSEPAGRRIIGTVCSSNNALETMLESVVRLNQRRYVCSCRGRSSHFNRGDRNMYCYMHYWECPLST